MAKSKKLNIELPQVDDLFTTQEERIDNSREKVMELAMDEISDFPSHPLKVRQDEAMMEMVESVREYGILVPALVRPKEGGGYEMAAGHRRKLANQLARNDTLPCIVRNLSDDEATIIMVDSNLQREQLLPSEKAFAYRMKLEAMKRQGQRTDLTCGPMDHKSDEKKSRDIIAEQMGESGRQVQRYIRLTELIPPILDLVDDNKMAFRPAVELSYLDSQEQETLLDMMGYEDCTPSLEQATKMKAFAKEGRLNQDVILSILQEVKPNQVEKIKIPKDKIGRFFPEGTSQDQIEEIIVKALELYQKRQRQKEAGR